MGNEFRVNSYQNNWQEDSNVLALRDGGFLVTWSSYFNEYDDTDVVSNYVAAQFYDAAGRRVGSEMILRGVTDGNSESPQAAQLANGNIVVTWSESLDGAISSNGARIRAQIFDTRGNEVSDIIKVDTVQSFRSVAPDVVATGDGGFIVSFGIEASGETFDDVYARAYTSTGQPRGSDKLLNTKSNDFDELVAKSAALTNGNSVVVWNSEAAIDDGTASGQNQIRATLFDNSGKVIKSDFGLTPHFGGAGGVWTDSENYGYSVAARSDGGFAVANLDWTPRDDDAGAKGIYFTAYDASGRQVIDRVPVFEKGIVAGDVEMARLWSGHYVIVWNQHSLNEDEVGDDGYGVIVSASGRPVSSVFTIGLDYDDYTEQVDLSVAALAGGGFVVSYTSDSIDSDDEGIAATIYGRGTAGNDTLTVDATGTMYGLGGDDRLTGNSKNNVLYGGDGDDLLTGNGGADVLSGGNGNDTVSYATASKGVQVSLADPSLNSNDAKGDTFSSIENVIGSKYDDRLSGDSGRNKLSGGDGDDRLYGDAGADVLSGGAGNDTVSYAGVSKGITVSLAKPSLNTNDAKGDTFSSIENLIGSKYDDRIHGNSGNNKLSGGDGDDRLYGDAGKDVLSGGSGRDTVSYAGVSKGVVVSLDDPSLNTNDARGDTFSSIEDIIGSRYADSLRGNDGNNALSGGDGNDRLFGDGGRDVLHGGSGKDVFVFKSLSDLTKAPSTTDLILDFSHGAGDRIDLTVIDANTKAGGNQAFTFIGDKGYSGKAGELRYSREASETRIVGDVNGDKKSDFLIVLDDAMKLYKDDFIL